MRNTKGKKWFYGDSEMYFGLFDSINNCIIHENRTTCRPAVHYQHRYHLHGLYLGNTCITSDRLSMWSIDGPSHGPCEQGYNFTISWKKNLSSVQSTALGLYNFKVAPQKMLSYIAEFV